MNDAKAELITLEVSLLQLTSDLHTAKGAKTSAINDLYAAVRGGGSASALDSAVALVISTADGWSDQVVTYQTAVQNTKHFEDTYNSLVALAIKYNNMLANRMTLIPQLQNDIANLDTQIAALPDGAAKDALRDQRNAKAGELGLLNNPMVLQAERDKAEADRDQAQTDWIAAQAAEALALGQISTTVNSYQGAYSSLNTSTAGPYTITHPTLGYGCTPTAPPAAACPPNSVDTAVNTSNRLRALMGVPPSQSGATAPHEDSVFMKPKKLERELEALTSQVNAGRVRVTDAQTRYDDLVAQTNTSPACDITGSPVAPFTPEAAIELLIDTDTKGGTR